MTEKIIKYDKILKEYEEYKEKTMLALKEKTAEIEQLQQLIAENQQTIDSLPVGISIYNSQGKVESYNKHFTQLFGYTIEHISQVNDWFSTVYPEEKYRDEIRKKWFAAIDQYHITKNFSPIEARVRCKDNTYKEIEFSFEAIGNTYLTTFVDLTDRKKALQNLLNAESELKNSEKKYRLLFESANDAIFLMDGEIFIDCNEQTLRMFECKREDIIGKPPYYFSPKIQPDGSKSKQKAIHFIQSSIEKKIRTFEWQHKTLYGKLFYAEVSLNSIKLNNKIYLQAIVRNTNERKIAELELQKYRNNLEKLVKKRTEDLINANENLQAANEELSAVNEQIEIQKMQLGSTLNNLKETQTQLVQSEKMASLGILTAGVAHEINNPLNYIQAGIYGLEYFYEKLKTDEDRAILEKILNDMQVGVERVSNIISSLNSFSRPGYNTEEPCIIHRIIKNCILLLDYKMYNKCTVVTEFFDEDFCIIADEVKLHHVFTNIILNAEHAIENEGVIKIRTFLNAKKTKIKILIEDNGKGISKENLDKIYDPFFTTNEPGKGTGLGLSIVFRIIEEHHGTILYTSELDKGTKVHISLPIKHEKI